MRLPRVFPLVLVASLGTMAAQEAAKAGRGRRVIPSPIKITIPAFPDGGVIPSKYDAVVEMKRRILPRVFREFPRKLC